MHTWATVSHDVFYKKPNTHKDFEREMFAISSLFSFADLRFDAYHNSVTFESSTNIPELSLNVPIDFDSLTSYIEQRYSDRISSSPVSIVELAHELEVLGYTGLSQLDDLLTKSKHAFLTYEKENPLGLEHEKLDGVGVIRVSVAIGNSQDKTKDSFYVKNISKYRLMMEG